VSIEVHDVVVARMLAKMPTQLIEGRRPEQLDLSRGLFSSDKLAQRPRDGAEAHILLTVRPSYHEKDVDSILRKRIRERLRIADFVQAPFDLAGLIP